jgi:8-oxo-dGTP pyrophosphatase MutT (NUDIX family)
MSDIAPTGWDDFTSDGFVTRARACLSQEPYERAPELGADGLRGDHVLNPFSTPSPERLATLRTAAVLVPVMVHEGEAGVLLTQRTEELPAHAGQVAFPGGKIEAQDETPIHAALREAEEEIGLPSSHVEPLGYLRPYHTTSGFKVIPVVGAVRPGFTVVPDEREVAAVFEVPLSFLMDPVNHQRHSRIWNGMRRHYFAMPFENRYIWGITAGIIRELYDEVYCR